MLKYIAVLVLTVAGIKANTQNLVFPAYFASGEMPLYGEYFSDTLTNEGESAARFYFNYQSKDSFGTVRPELEKIFFSDSMFAQWLFTRATSANPEERLLEYVKALGWFFKNQRHFRNYLNITIPSNVIPADSGHALMDALNGGNASFHNIQCDAYARRGLLALYHLYLFKLDTMACKPGLYRQVHLPGHSVFEIRYKGSWAFVDIDPSTPGFMFPNTQGEYYSLQDLQNDPNRVKSDWVFTKDDNSPFEEVVPEADQLDNYRVYFSGNANYEPTMDQVMLMRPKGYDIGGEVVLPAGAFLVFRYNNYALSVDVSKEENRDVINTVTKYFDDYKENNDPAFLDSAYQLLGDHFGYQGINTSMVPDILARNGIGFYSTDWKPTYELSDSGINELSYYIETTTDTLYIGKDIKGPFMVVGVKTDNPVVIGNITVTDSFYVKLWDGSGTGGPAGIPHQELDYLTRGFIPPNTKCRIDVACNQGYLDWWNGYSIDTLGQADTLSLKRTQQVAVYNPATAIADNAEEESGSRAVRLRAAQFMRRYPACKELINAAGQTVRVTYYMPTGLYYMPVNGTTLRVLIVN